MLRKKAFKTCAHVHTNKIPVYIQKLRQYHMIEKYKYFINTFNPKGNRGFSFNEKPFIQLKMYTHILDESEIS